MQSLPTKPMNVNIQRNKGSLLEVCDAISVDLCGKVCYAFPMKTQLGRNLPTLGKSMNTNIHMQRKSTEFMSYIHLM